jgi:hypothetical protein
MKLVKENGKQKVVMSKSEWESIGKDQGWMPKKRLFAAETNEEQSRGKTQRTSKMSVGIYSMSPEDFHSWVEKNIKPLLDHGSTEEALSKLQEIEPMANMNDLINLKNRMFSAAFL